jgi:hypothetical protein
MRTLQDAWSWCRENRRLVQLMSRLGRDYWGGMPWDEMEKDESFRNLEGLAVEQRAEEVLLEIDDIAIFVLFSVFEASVRDHVLEDVKGEAANLKHPALVKTAERMRENIEEGSFYSNVLSLFKGLDHNLVEAVSQVRAYRNWVAHGRRPGKKPSNTTPREAFNRLNAFLILIGADSESRPIGPQNSDGSGSIPGAVD